MIDQQQIADWTIMVYISADDVLANFAVESLKQLKRAAAPGITVMAQFDANGKQNVRLLHFAGDKNKDASLKNNKDDKEDELPPHLNMAAAETLTAFINCATEEYPARHYGLVLWGHGTELLLDEDQGSKNNGQANASARKYMTPANLKKALEATKLFGSAPGKRKLDLIGLDACSMSMVEVATELEGSVNYMIASQDDVPDASFPYEQILTGLKEHDRNDVPGICKMVPHFYKQAFQDYLPTPGPGIKELTLSSLDLKQTSGITVSLKRLTDALLSSASTHDGRMAIIAARVATRAFVQGIFVDLFDFCNNLIPISSYDELKSACKEVCDAISARGNNAWVIENQSDKNSESRCHGVSIYFPYFTDEENKQTEDFLGGIAPTDVVTHLSLLVKGGNESLHKARTARIEELEEDFQLLHQFGETGWSGFIAQGWSFILATELPEELDRHYSAQQCARNLLSRWQSPPANLQGMPEKRGITVMPEPREERTAS